MIVQTARAATVHGRLEFEGGRPASIGSVRIMSRPSRDLGLVIGAPVEPASVAANDTFVLSGLFGPQVLHTLGLPRPWVVKEIRYEESDVLGRAVELKAGSDPSRLRIVVTNRSATLKGRVDDLGGLDPANVRVLFYPADRPWEAETSGPGFSGPLDEQGAFAFPPVRAGDYYIVAMPVSDVPLVVRAGDFAARIKKFAERITLGESEERAISLRVTRAPLHL